MEDNVKHTTETVGTIAESFRSFNGQANTRQYSDAEKDNPESISRGDRTFPQQWDTAFPVNNLGRVDPDDNAPKPAAKDTTVSGSEGD